MATFLSAALPYLMGSGGASAAGLSGMGGLANILGGGADGFGTVAGSTLGGGMQGSTQGSGLLGALSGGSFGNLFGSGDHGQEKGDAMPSYSLPMFQNKKFTNGLLK